MDKKQEIPQKIFIYIERDALEEIIICDDDYPNLNHIFNNHAIVLVDLTDPELTELLEDDESAICQLNKNDVAIYALEDYFALLKDDNSSLEDKTRAMFFLDISKEQADALSEKYGIIVQSVHSIDDSVLQLSFKKNLDKEDDVSGCSNNGWNNLLTTLNLPPSNSMIITDNYLLQNDVGGESVGFENLKLILDAILPKTLGVVFHLLIVTPMPLKISPEKANQLYGKLKAYLKTIRNYEILLEIVFNKTIHPRKIISNYYVLVCDKGFQLFHPRKTTQVNQENEITLTSVLHDTSRYCGDTVFVISYKDIAKIKEVCQNTTKQVLGAVQDPSIKILGTSTADKRLRNRLLNTVNV